MFYLPAYRITPIVHPVKCPPQCPSPIHPHPPPTSPSITPSSFPRVRSLYVLSLFLIFPTRFFSVPLYSLSLLFIFPKWMRTYNVCPSPIDLLHSVDTIQFHPRWIKWWYLSFLMSEQGPPFLSLHLLSLLWYECYWFISGWHPYICLCGP